MTKYKTTEVILAKFIFIYISIMYFQTFLLQQLYFIEINICLKQMAAICHLCAKELFEL